MGKLYLLFLPLYVTACIGKFALPLSFKNTNLKTSSIHIHNLVEVVHVELAYKGGHVGVLVVVGQHGAGELGLVFDSEGASFFCPADQMSWEWNLYFKTWI